MAPSMDIPHKPFRLVQVNIKMYATLSYLRDVSFLACPTKQSSTRSRVQLAHSHHGDAAVGSSPPPPPPRRGDVDVRRRRRRGDERVPAEAGGDGGHAARRRRLPRAAGLQCSAAGPHHAGRPDRPRHDRLLGDAEAPRQQRRPLRPPRRQPHPHRQWHLPALLLRAQVPVGIHPPRHPHRPRLRHQVPLRRRLRRHRQRQVLLLHDAAQARARRAVQVRAHRRPRADVPLQRHAEPLRGVRRRRGAVHRRPVVRGQPPGARQQPVGHVGAVRGAERGVPAVDLDDGEPRAGLRAGAGGDDAVQAVHEQVPDAVRGVGEHAAAVVLGEDGVGARDRAGVVRGVRQVHAAVEVAGGGAEARGQGGDAMADRVRALAVVQQQRIPLHGGGVDARGVRAVARRRQGRRGARRARPLVRADAAGVERGVRHRQRDGDAGVQPVGAGVHQHRRRGEHRGARRRLPVAAAGLLGVPGGQLRPRHAADRQPDARLLRVAPQQRRRQGRRRPCLVHQPILVSHRHQLATLNFLRPTSSVM
uniref:Purple acid phosphatase n=1 Tax=Oryza nivara TaxID=4536 RepID=A0A0E0GI85_ORYNI